MFYFLNSSWLHSDKEDGLTERLLALDHVDKESDKVEQMEEGGVKDNDNTLQNEGDINEENIARSGVDNIEGTKSPEDDSKNKQGVNDEPDDGRKREGLDDGKKNDEDSGDVTKGEDNTDSKTDDKADESKTPEEQSGEATGGGNKSPVSNSEGKNADDSKATESEKQLEDGPGKDESA